jgi:hypothetical protein
MDRAPDVTPGSGLLIQPQRLTTPKTHKCPAGNNIPGDCS